MTLLVLDAVAAGYGEVDVVSAISLAVAEREIVTIAGTNGAGKSTSPRRSWAWCRAAPAA